MSELTPATFTVIQSYGGRKEAEFTLASATAADTIDFSDYFSSDATMCLMQQVDDGTVVGALICATDSSITIGSGPSSSLMIGKITYDQY